MNAILFLVTVLPLQMSDSKMKHSIFFLLFIYSNDLYLNVCTFCTYFKKYFHKKLYTKFLERYCNFQNKKMSMRMLLHFFEQL
jgi:hypothetical protein